MICSSGFCEGPTIVLRRHAAKADVVWFASLLLTFGLHVFYSNFLSCKYFCVLVRFFSDKPAVVTSSSRGLLSAVQIRCEFWPPLNLRRIWIRARSKEIEKIPWLHAGPMWSFNLCNFSIKLQDAGTWKSDGGTGSLLCTRQRWSSRRACKCRSFFFRSLLQLLVDQSQASYQREFCRVIHRGAALIAPVFVTCSRESRILVLLFVN
jgi:hypothetical protein